MEGNDSGRGGAAYRTHLTMGTGRRASADEDFVTDVAMVFADWLGQRKGIKLDPLDDVDAREPDRRVEVRHAQDSGRHYLKALLRESSPVGEWRSEILASSEGWIDLNVSNSEGRFASVPNLAKDLLATLSLSDGLMSLTDQPITVLPEEVDDLVSTILDVDRHGLVFVAGAGNEAGVLAPFAERLPRWTGQVHGLGQAYLLVPEATSLFNQRMGAFGVRQWSLRTYYPSVDRTDIEDSRRHRYLSTATLNRLSPGAVGNLLGSTARAHAASHADEPDVIRVRRIFERRATARVVEALRPERQAAAPAAVEETEAVTVPEEVTPTERADGATSGKLEHLLGLVRSIFGIEEVTEASLRARAATDQLLRDSAVKATSLIEDQQDSIFVLEDDLRSAADALDDAQLDEAELHEQLDDLRGENRWLRDRLAEASDHEGAYGVPQVEVDDRPQGLVDVATALMDDKVPHMVFCGDIDKTVEVQVADTVGNAARRAWDACLTLSEYAAAVLEEGYTGGFDHYLRQSGRSTRLSASRHAVGETKATLDQFGHLRDFPVPTSVDERGVTRMVAHIKLAQIGRVSPRLYYIDRVKQDGLVYVGYIGPHPRTATS